MQEGPHKLVLGVSGVAPEVGQVRHVTQEVS